MPVPSKQLPTQSQKKKCWNDIESPEKTAAMDIFSASCQAHNIISFDLVQVIAGWVTVHLAAFMLVCKNCIHLSDMSYQFLCLMWYYT